MSQFTVPASTRPSSASERAAIIWGIGVSEGSAVAIAINTELVADDVDTAVQQVAAANAA